MNERLKELKLMALEKFAYNHGLRLVHLGDLDPKSQEEVDALFAESIVKDCANRASWAQDTGEKDVGGEVLKHFGINE